MIRRDANRIWDCNGGQVDNENSSRKWRAVIQRWREVGFKVSDKSTWVVTDARLGTAVDCEDFEFTEEERQLMVEEMAPVLVGKKQALKEPKQQEVIRAVKFFLRYVKCHDGEIAQDALPTVLRDFDLKLKRACKKQAFFDLLRKWGWIYVRAEYWHPAQQGKEGPSAEFVGSLACREREMAESPRDHGRSDATLSRLGKVGTEKRHHT